MRTTPAKPTTNYGISAVRYNADRSLVHRVRLHEMRADALGPPLEIGRDQLVGALEAGRVVLTIQTDAAGRFVPAAGARLVGVKGRLYVRCDEASAPSDDLTDLPRF